jgi:hypothetical protein
MLHKKPYVPFRIILTGGTQFDGTVPTLVAIGESLLFYYFPHTDRFMHARLTQIAAVEQLQTV